MLSDDEVLTIVRAVRAMSPDAGDDEIHFILEWAVHTRTHFALLKGVLTGVVNCRWNYEDGDVVFVGSGLVSTTPAE
jgi:hypothetical protein